MLGPEHVFVLGCASVLDSVLSMFWGLVVRLFWVCVHLVLGLCASCFGLACASVLG